MPSRPRLRFGIIGCSSVARRRFLPALLKSSSARLERIGSRSPQKAAEFAAAFSCAKAGSYEAVLEDPEVDAIYISIPVTLRDQWLREAVRRKKHILAEKPAFCSLSSAVEMVGLCQKQGVRMMEGYMFRYHPQHALAHQLLKEDRIGQTRIFSGVYAVPRPAKGNIRFEPELGGGVFLDAAGYLPAAAELQLDSPPMQVLCKKRLDPSTGVDDLVVMLVEFEDGVFGHLTAAYGLQYRGRYALHGTRGRVEVERAFAVAPEVGTAVSLETDKGVASLPVAPADQFLLMIDDFAEQVGAQGAVNKDYEGQLLRQHKFMEAARRSASEQRPVALAECST